MKGVGMLVGNFEKPLKEANLGMGQFFWPLKETILLQCCLVIDVIENFDYMNWVNNTNWLLNIYLRVQP